MAHLLALLTTTVIFVSLEAAPANIKSVMTIVTDFKYNDRSATQATKNMIYRKIAEATSRNGPSMLKMVKLELENMKGNIAAIYTVNAPNCKEVSRDAGEVMKYFKPVTYIKYKCGGEHELLRHGNSWFVGMTYLLALVIATTAFVFLEAAPATLIAGATVVFDFKYDDKTANAATKDMILEKLSEAAEKNGPSKLKVVKLELKNVDGNLAADYTVTAPNCKEISRDAQEVMKNYKPAIYIKYDCDGEHEIVRHGNSSHLAI